jgi:ammonia channel protein AmtB
LLTRPHSAVKTFLRIDDPLDIFAQHGLIGILGLFFNGLFATADVISLDNVNTTTRGGVLDQNYKQLYIQVVYIIACSGYVFATTALIAKIFCLIPLLNLRASDHAELVGIDNDQVGLFNCNTKSLEFTNVVKDWGVCRRLHRGPPGIRQIESPKCSDREEA